MEIFQIITALFIFLFLVAPVVMLIVVLVGGRNSKQTPIQSIKLEELEQNDYTIIEDTNKAFHDVSQTLKSIEKRIDDIEKKIEREDTTIKGFGNKK
jgi:peptidoglycan hydrolase CwlO-like protein